MGFDISSQHLPSLPYCLALTLPWSTQVCNGSGATLRPVLLDVTDDASVRGAVEEVRLG